MDDNIIRLPGGRPARPQTSVPITVAVKLTVTDPGDVVVSDGRSDFVLEPGTWRIVDNEIYERLFAQAAAAKEPEPEPAPSRAARRKQAARDRRN